MLKNNKIFLHNLGFSIIILGGMLICCNITYYGTIKQEETTLLKEFFEKQSSQKEKLQISKEEKKEYIGVLEIPKINFKRGFLSLEHPDNTIEKNIQVLPPSTMPDKEFGNLIIAAHSGSGRIAFFKDLDQLHLKDEIKIYYNKQIYYYKVDKIYEEPKNQKIEIKKEDQTTTLTLTTCKPNTKNRQLIIISTCYKIEPYKSKTLP